MSFSDEIASAVAHLTEAKNQVPSWSGAWYTCSAAIRRANEALELFQTEENERAKG